FFFFSSRRRHTRWPRDWSSDVCSSDLCVDETHNFVADNVIVHNSNVADAIRWALGENNARVLRAKRNEELIFGGSESRKALSMRSEERRVGKECRSWCETRHTKKSVCE